MSKVHHAATREEIVEQIGDMLDELHAEEREPDAWTSGALDSAIRYLRKGYLDSAQVSIGIARLPPEQRSDWIVKPDSDPGYSRDELQSRFDSVV